jgi:hypothetical protein
MVIMSAFAAKAEPTYAPAAGSVPDTETAIQIAKAVLVPVYGDAKIKAQEPFSATLKDDIWRVEGHLSQGVVGGAALVEIAKSDGRIIRMIHGK